MNSSARALPWWLATASVLGLLVAFAGPAAATVSYATIEGSGSTWSKTIVDAWIASVDSKGIPVVYTGTGSSIGRKSFAADTTDFGITEVPYQEEDHIADLSAIRPFAYLPIVAGGTAFTYQVRIGTKRLDNLRLSGDTLAKIFTGKITNWKDPAITKDMNGVQLPDLAITPVIRSDGSGTTAQFTAWLDSQQPDIWRPYFGRSGSTSYYPKTGNMVGANGSDQVMNNITSEKNGNGMIGYVEYSYPVQAGYPVVKLLNDGGYFTEPTQYNVAVALTKAIIVESPDLTKNLTSDLSGVYVNKDVRTYPMSSYSYMLLPVGTDEQDHRMSTEKRQSLADFMFYSLCEGQKDAGALGYSPLPLNLVSAGFDQLERLKTADPEVDINERDVTKCHNPTFDGSNLEKNVLAAVAPMPPSCDKYGQGPCTSGTGKAPTSVAEATDPGASDEAATSTEVDPATGLPVGQVAAAGPGSSAVAAELAGARRGDTPVFALLAVLELLLIILAPGVVTFAEQRWSARNK